MEILSDEQYYNFINGNDKELYSIFTNLLLSENDFDSIYNKLQLFFKDIEKKYFTFLKNNVFNTSDNELFYLNLKNNNDIFKHLSKIYNFYLDRILVLISDKLKNSNENYIVTDAIIKYNNYFNLKMNIFNENLFIEELPFYYNVDENIDFFYEKIQNDLNYFNLIKKNDVFIKKNDKIYLSDFFKNKLSFIFLINPNENLNEIEYNDNLLDNFYFIMFRRY